MKEKNTRSFYLVSRHFPPTNRAYRTPQDKGKRMPAGLSEEQQRSWAALSLWSTEEGARRAALQARQAGKNLGDIIVRFDVPAGMGITWQETIEPGHFDLKGDLKALKNYLADFRGEV